MNQHLIRRDVNSNGEIVEWRDVPQELDLLAKKFMQRVDISGECWIWTAGKASFGYGLFSLGTRGERISAHRFSWFLAHGEIPEGMNVLHRCDRPSCVRPSHLFLGTQADNMADMSQKGRAGSTQHPESRPRGTAHWTNTMPELRLTGEKNGHACLDWELVRQIRALYAAGGISQRALASRFRVNQQTIWSIVNGRTWKMEAMPSCLAS